MSFGFQPGNKNQENGMFDAGVGFYEAALRAGQPIALSDGTICCPTTPAIVCFAFAAELFLKSLLKISNQSVMGHSLEVLFIKLEEPFKSEVIDAYKKLTKKSADEMLNDLKTVSNAFVDWRYVYESTGQQISPQLLMALAQSAYEVIRKHRPAWPVNGYLDERIRSEIVSPEHVINLGGGKMVAVRFSRP